MTVKNDSPIFCKVCDHQIPVSGNASSYVTCQHCGTRNKIAKGDSWRTVIFSLTALIFYLPANILPFITVDLYGSHNTPTIWGGVVTLTESGSWPIAIVIFLASMVIPLLKILALFYLSATARNGENKKLKTYIYQTVEAIGRWSMLDIFLLAILVAVMKLGTWAHAEPEVGSLMFLFVVIFTMLASASFNPKIIWEQNNEES